MAKEIRRTFSRSELRRRALDAAREDGYTDPERSRVKTWYRCAKCKKLEAGYKVQVDHIQPVIRPGTVLEGLSWDEYVDRVWCDEKNLQVLCLNCHQLKSQCENSERRRIKKEK